MTQALGTFARLLAVAPPRALAYWRERRGDLRIAFDRDPPFSGARLAEPALPWSSLESRLRSWEMLDRVTRPGTTQEADAAAREVLGLLACPGVLEDALLVRLDAQGCARLLVHLEASAWHALGTATRASPELPAHEARVRAFRGVLDGP